MEPAPAVPKSRLERLFLRLEALSLRERVMVVAGIPMVLLLVCEGLIFSPARARTEAAGKLAQIQEGELKALRAVVAAQPNPDVVPAIDQLQKQRDALLQQISSARGAMDNMGRSVDWSTLVRATVAGKPGLTLTTLKALPPEVIFEPTRVAPLAAPAASRPARGRKADVAAPTAPKPAAGAGDVAVYRHRAELGLSGDMGLLLAYLQSLQQLPGELYWEQVQLNAAGFPLATVKMTVYTLSTRPETPFN